MFYWQCTNCNKICEGGYIKDYFIDDRNYGEDIVKLPVKEIKRVLNNA